MDQSITALQREGTEQWHIDREVSERYVSIWKEVDASLEVSQWHLCPTELPLWTNVEGSQISKITRNPGLINP